MGALGRNTPPIWPSARCRIVNTTEILRLVRVSQGVATVRSEDGRVWQEAYVNLTQDGVGRAGRLAMVGRGPRMYDAMRAAQAENGETE